MKFLVSQTLLCALLVGVCIAGEPDWNYSEPVVFKDYHDPLAIRLADGRDLQCAFTEWTYEGEVEKWQPGRKLTITYKPNEGVWLVDDATKKKTRIREGLLKHPIDIMFHRHMEKEEAFSTHGMVEGNIAAALQWDKEMERIYEEILATLPEDRKAPVIEAHEKWKEFRDAESKAILAICDVPGTMHRITAANRLMHLVRDRAMELKSYQNEWPGHTRETP